MNLMTNELPPVRVDTTTRFDNEVKRLRKKYPNIRTDVAPLVTALEHGDQPGDKVQGVGSDVYKVRLSNRDAAKGKRGGYRVIYYVKLADLVVLLRIYSKSEKADLTHEEIRRIIADYNSLSE
jgi:mRNA-degrading endonuclease RelE of RelBE toxin-antitoxin system